MCVKTIRVIDLQSEFCFRTVVRSWSINITNIVEDRDLWESFRNVWNVVSVLVEFPWKGDLITIVWGYRVNSVYPTILFLTRYEDWVLLVVVQVCTFWCNPLNKDVEKKSSVTQNNRKFLKRHFNMSLLPFLYVCMFYGRLSSNFDVHLELKL